MAVTHEDVERARFHELGLFAEPDELAKPIPERSCRGETGAWVEQVDARGRRSTRWRWDRVAPDMAGPKANWYEALPHFWLPLTWSYDPNRWPDYTDPAYVRAFEDVPDPSELIRILSFGRVEPRAWGAWAGAWG